MFGEFSERRDHRRGVLVEIAGLQDQGFGLRVHPPCDRFVIGEYETADRAAHELVCTGRHDRDTLGERLGEQVSGDERPDVRGVEQDARTDLLGGVDQRAQVIRNSTLLPPTTTTRGRWRRTTSTAAGDDVEVGKPQAVRPWAGRARRTADVLVAHVAATRERLHGHEVTGRSQGGQRHALAIVVLTGRQST